MRRQVWALSAVILWTWTSASGCERLRQRVVDAGVSFDRVSFSSARLGQPLQPPELDVIESVARAELAHAFDGLRIAFSNRRDARYQIAVVQQLFDQRIRGMAVAGESRAISGVGGRGAVNFSLLASSAVACAADAASRQEIIEAIGRGVGRAAAHEFAHQLLPTAPLHDSADVESYEYASAGRCQQYFGPMHWDVAGPLLRARIGR